MVTQSEESELAELFQQCACNKREQVVALNALQRYVHRNALEAAHLAHIGSTVALLVAHKNHKVALAAVRVIQALVCTRAGHEHACENAAALLLILADALAHSRQVVRAEAGQVILAIILAISLPRAVERLDPALTHESPLARTAAFQVLILHIRRHGLVGLSSDGLAEQLLPRVARGLGDAYSTVRRAAHECAAVVQESSHAPLVPWARPSETLCGTGASLRSRNHALALPVCEGNERPSQLRPRSGSGLRKSARPGAGTADDEPQHVELSEAELTAELTVIAKQLDISAEWESRVAALKRLHGIALGGAGSYPEFADSLRSRLKEPLVAQITDRRSQVSRVACAAVAAAVAAAGQRAEPLAVSLMPELFKIAVIAIVVMADAADACVRRMLTHCYSLRLLRMFVDALLHEKSNKLRLRCAEWVHLALREWPQSVYEGHLDLVRAGVKKAVSDAASETRAEGKVLFVTYASLYPHEGPAVLAGLDMSMQAKLRKALAEGPGASAATAVLPVGHASRPGTGGSLRRTGLHTEPLPLGSSAGVASSRRPVAAPAESALTRTGLGSGPVRAVSAAKGDLVEGDTPVSLDTAVGNVLGLSASAEWDEWEAALSCATDSACRSNAKEISCCLPRLQLVLRDGLTHKHKRVTNAAVDLFHAACSIDPAAFEEAMVELFPPLMALFAAASKTTLQPNKAEPLLTLLGSSLGADALLPALLQTVREAPARVKVGALDFFCSHIGQDKAAGVPSGTRVVPDFLAACLEDVTHVQLDVRRAATRAVGAMYRWCPDLVAQKMAARSSQEYEVADRGVLVACSGLQSKVNALRTSEARAAGAASVRSAYADRQLPSSQGPPQPSGTEWPQPATVHAPNGDSGGSRDVSELADSVSLRIDDLLAKVEESPETCKAVINSLRDAMDIMPKPVREAKLPLILSKMRLILASGMYELYGSVSAMFKDMALTAPEALELHLTPALDALLAAYDAVPMEEHATEAKYLEDALCTIAEHCHPRALVAYYTSRFPSTDAPKDAKPLDRRNQLRLLATMMRVTMLQSKRKPTEEEVLPLLPLLQAGLSCNCPRVRMHTTEGWLAAFAVIGHRLDGYLNALPKTQKKLVYRWCSRMYPGDGFFKTELQTPLGS